MTRDCYVMAGDNPSGWLPLNSGPLVNIVGSSAKGNRQKMYYTVGLRAAIDELRANVAESISISDVGDSAHPVLISALSPYDVYRILKIKRGRCPNIVVGGFGAVPFLPLLDVVDRVFMGRVEQHGDFLRAESQYIATASNRRPVMRRARALLPGEDGVGCKRRCAFCQYRAIRRPIIDTASGYGKSDNRMSAIHQDVWQYMHPHKAFQLSALDGLSEATRKRVNKPVTDQQVISKIQEVVDNVTPKHFSLKIMQIIGYPWETEGSVKRDLQHFLDVLREVRPRHGNRVMLTLKATPFVPMPFTPLAQAPAQVGVNWRDLWCTALRDNTVNPGLLSEHVSILFPQSTAIEGQAAHAKLAGVWRIVDPDVLRAIGGKTDIAEILTITGDAPFVAGPDPYTDTITIE